MNYLLHPMTKLFNYNNDTRSRRLWFQRANQCNNHRKTREQTRNLFDTPFIISCTYFQMLRGYGCAYFHFKHLKREHPHLLCFVVCLSSKLGATATHCVGRLLDPRSKSLKSTSNIAFWLELWLLYISMHWTTK